MRPYTAAEIIAVFPPAVAAPPEDREADPWLEKLEIIGGKRPDSRYLIECPFAELHSPGGGTTAMYGPPHTGGYAKAHIHCFHDHCKGRPLAEYAAKVGVGVSVPPLTRVDLTDVMTAELVPPEFVIAPWIPKRVVTLMGGNGGMGKSYLALVLAAHVACGRQWADKEVEQGKVLFVSLEDEAHMVRYRLRQILEHYKLDAQVVLANLTLLDGTAQFSPLMKCAEGMNAVPHFTEAYDMTKENAPGHSFIIIDNASDAFDAGENIRRHVRMFIAGLTGVAREVGAAVVLLAHIDKHAARNGAGGHSYSGSTAWHNSCRSRLALISKDKQILLVHEKNNFGGLAEAVSINFGKHGVPMVSEARCEDEHVEDEDIDELLTCFLEVEKVGEKIPPKLQNGNYSVQQLFCEFDTYPARLLAGEGKKKVPKILRYMKKEGLFVEREYVHTDRHRKKELILTQKGRDRVGAPF